MTSVNFTNEIVGITIAILVVFISYLKWKMSYWNRKGVKILNPALPFGDCRKLILGKTTFGEQFKTFYEEFKAQGLQHGGVYIGVRPIFVPTDPELIKNILQKDFQHFVNHGTYINEEVDPLSGHLFNLQDTKWKYMRVKLTPTFTSGKMKMMFQTLTDCTTGLKSIMDKCAIDHTPIDIKEILARFTTDIIGSAAFGLECNSLKDPNAEFRKYGRKVFEINRWDRIKFLLEFMVPHSMLKAINFKATKSDVEEFFIKAIENTVNYREKTNIYRKDYMQLLMQLKNKSIISDDDITRSENGNIQEKAITMNELAAQAFVFFIAGYETSSTTMTFALYELTTNPHVQDKLREEINTVLRKHNDQLTYEAVMEMSYMDKVLNETLRKYPPVPTLSRKCNKGYQVPNTSIRIEKGTDVFIPVLGLHNDPEYYPNPELFDPERFSEENKTSRPPFTWLPFGEGPRVCIGLRFGLLQSKVGLIALLKNYKIKLNPKTILPLQLEKSSFFTTAEGGIWINVDKLD